MLTKSCWSLNVLECKQLGFSTSKQGIVLYVFFLRWPNAELTSQYSVGHFFSKKSSVTILNFHTPLDIAAGLQCTAKSFLKWQCKRPGTLRYYHYVGIWMQVVAPNPNHWPYVWPRNFNLGWRSLVSLYFWVCLYIQSAKVRNMKCKQKVYDRSGQVDQVKSWQTRSSHAMPCSAVFLMTGSVACSWFRTLTAATLATRTRKHEHITPCSPPAPALAACARADWLEDPPTCLQRSAWPGTWISGRVACAKPATEGPQLDI